MNFSECSFNALNEITWKNNKTGTHLLWLERRAILFGQLNSMQHNDIWYYVCLVDMQQPKMVAKRVYHFVIHDVHRSHHQLMCYPLKSNQLSDVVFPMLNNLTSRQMNLKNLIVMVVPSQNWDLLGVIRKYLHEHFLLGQLKKNS